MNLGIAISNYDWVWVKKIHPDYAIGAHRFDKVAGAVDTKLFTHGNPAIDIIVNRACVGIVVPPGEIASLLDKIDRGELTLYTH